ncbi:MAG: hypothetical protein HYX55_09050 [Chloroflexi bacterium]|nr:hypothetical protein [Chloroflexota bacterium]
MDLDGEPIQEPVARERLLAERRGLHLADLYGVLGHAEVPSAGREAGNDDGWARAGRLLVLDRPVERRER